MRQAFRSVILFFAVLTWTGCYHAQVTTGLEPGNRVIDKPWALGFIYGLIPPAVVEAESQCTGGVAKVETRLSFLNQLVNGLTFGIVTPMHIRVTCAAPRAASAIDVRVPSGATDVQITDAFESAVEQAADRGAPVYVQFD